MRRSYCPFSFSRGSSSLGAANHATEEPVAFRKPLWLGNLWADESGDKKWGKEYSVAHRATFKAMKTLTPSPSNT